MYLSNNQVQKRYNISRTTIWRWTEKGIMPKPHDIGGLKRWRLDELERWEKKLN
ncbi:putative DNA-binding transcriptional regulator AlpA [Natronocella acetinitrilica]|uniref:DNA-binding transcriptional regulator AlpA n=1 Tax=Natronocella acetinitrilica TaxID=414046 RepID=A0AAE3G6G4_9GAMM|nr:putative DNA-binding transcriptional regulator AlpA [Natronocella acetinitrilica]